jgi:hypothetical protein
MVSGGGGGRGGCGGDGGDGGGGGGGGGGGAMSPQDTTAEVALPLAVNWKMPFALGLFSRANVTAKGVRTVAVAW